MKSKIWEYKIKVHNREFTKRMTVHGDERGRFIDKLQNKIRSEFEIDVLKPSKCLNVKVFLRTGDKEKQIKEMQVYVQCSPSEFVKRLF